jgi:enamine deaminase RidA (YjgF/YER057c/UK114 family)
MSLPIHHVISAGPRPVAPFSHAVEADGFVFVTGQMPTDPAAPDAPLPEGVEAQTRRVFDNLRLVLAGSVGIWPVTNTKPSASTACENGATGRGPAAIT